MHLQCCHCRVPSRFLVSIFLAPKINKTDDSIRVHDCLQSMGNRDDGDIWPNLSPKCALDHSIGFVICNRTTSISWGLTPLESRYNIPTADVARISHVLATNGTTTGGRKCEPSSRIRSLLLRTIARARETICLCPTDKLLPPPDM